MPELIPLLRNGNESEIEAYLRTCGDLKGMLCVVLLQAVQVISVVLPGAPIQVAVGIVYGTVRGFFLCHLSAVAANSLVFVLARRLGARMDRIVPVEEKSSKLDFLLKSDSPAYMTVVACLIPILPNGIIPHVAAKTKITLPQFTLAVYLGSLIPVLVLCAVGSKILYGSYIGAVLLLVGLFATVFLLTKFRAEVIAFLNKTFPKIGIK
jgi:uncharacterized membrane protein YdjX (TVP38/TMEM64 family)